MKQIDSFKNLLDLVKTFDTEAKCSKYIALKRWGDKPVCPHCSHSDKVYRFTDGIYFKCGSCRKKFTVRIGTIFGDSKIPLVKWFPAMYLFTSNSKGISSVQLARQISVTQKTAWFMLHRLRYGMENEEYKKPLENVVETDETLLGMKEHNKHQ
jgi:transposase-like protein